MKNKKLIPLIFFSIILINIVIAFQLESNIPSEVTTYINQPYQLQFELTLRNSTISVNNISLYNPSSYISMTPFSMNPHETKTAIITINNPTMGTFTENLVLRGYYFSQVTKQNEVKYIEIYSNNFNQTNIQISKNSRIQFINKDTISHKIKSEYFENSITPNNLFEYSFPDIKQVEVSDVFWFFKTYINVVDNIVNESTANPDYDYKPVLIIHNKYIETTATLDLDTLNITLNYNSGKEVLLTIKNTGTQTAKNLRLGDNLGWASFTKNGFDLGIGEQSYVVAMVTPHLRYTNETNKNYDLEIKLDSDNINSISRNIGIYIPFAEILTDEINETDNWWLQKLKFCRDFPNSTLCLAQPIYVYIPTENNSQLPVNVTLSQEQINNALRMIFELDEDFRRVGDTIQNNSDSLWNSINNIFRDNNSSLGMINSLEDKYSNLQLINFLILFIIMISIIGGFTYYLVNMVKKKKKEESRGSY